MNCGIDRRRVLTLLAASGVATVVPAAPASTDTLQWLAEGVDAEGLRELASSAASAGIPSSLPIAALVRDRTVAAEQLAPRIRELLRDDYTAGRTIDLSGWQVSRTEAWLYGALAQARS
jgi:hypothetical protein